MKPKIKLFLPGGDKLEAYVQDLLELKLVADISTEQLNWSDAENGSYQDWSDLAFRIHQAWDHVDGVMIWAPGTAALPTAGYLSLVYPEPGIPIITFSAPTDDISEHLELGLKSMLINAAFLAASDLAEVLLLSGTQVMRPKQAVWNLESGYLELQTSEHALAQVHYQLQAVQSHQSRSTTKPTLHQPASMDQTELIISDPGWFKIFATHYAAALYDDKDQQSAFLRERL